VCVERDIHDTRTRAERAIRDAHTCVQRVCLTLRARACVCARDAGGAELLRKGAWGGEREREREKERVNVCICGCF
jgi:hypothetical protein